jgi:hypothetical protein
VKVQDVLEEACFDFARRAMEDILVRRGWDCPQAAELNLWMAEFLQCTGKFGDKEGLVEKQLEKLFRSVADIRHAAVHRITVSARGMEQFFQDAESLVTLLGDDERLNCLSELRRNLQFTIEELERNKHILSSNLIDTLKRIAVQRAELDRQEVAAINEMVKEDDEYVAFAGKNIEQAVLAMEGVIGVIEKDAIAEVDDTSSVEGSDLATVGLINEVDP